MSRAQKKYRREEKAYKVKGQTMFNAESALKTRRQPKISLESKYSMTEQFACPFCLGLHEFRKYLISTKKGYHQGLAQCPECKNKCRFTTLTQITTAEQYAEFAYPYSGSGFWQKVPWNKWKDRLRRIGWAQAFWHRYMELKGEDKEPTVSDELYNAQEEWARERGYI